MGILSNLFKPKAAGSKFEPRKARYQSATTAEGESPASPAIEDAAPVPSPAPIAEEQPLKSISFGGSKKNTATSGSTQKKNIVVASDARAGKSTRKAVLPKGENTIPDKQIVIDLEDVLPQVPDELLKTDRPSISKKELRFSAYELLQSLALGKASVPLSKVLKAAPELFSDQRSDSNAKIELPLKKVVSQIGAFPCRPDQTEIQFPLLASQYANLVVENPEAVAAWTAKGAEKISEAADIPEPPSPVTQVEAGPVVEALSPALDVKDEEKEPVVEEEEPIEPMPELPKIEDIVSYSLAALLPKVPASWLAGDVKSADEAARITVPFHLIESQLATGRVELGFEDFLHGLPEDFKQHFSGASEEGKAARIRIPLNEVFQNLPGVEPLPPSPKPVVAETPVVEKEESENPEQVVENVIAPVPEVVEPVVPAEVVTGETHPEVKGEEIKEEKPAAPAVEIEAEEKAIEKPVAMEAAVEAPAPQPESEIKPVEAVKPVASIEAPVPTAPILEKLEIPIPSYREPMEPPQVAATMTPPKIQLQRVAPPTVFAKKYTALPAEEIVPEPEPGKILAFEGASLAFNPNAVETLFMTDGKLDSGKVVEHVSHFPDTNGVVLKVENETKTAGEIPTSFNPDTVANAATVMFQTLEDSSAQPDSTPTRDVTLRHDGFCSTWFKQRHILLGILHSQRSLEEGLHNKLVLVTEELAQLR